MTPEERKMYDRSGHLRRKYGVNLEEYNRMRKEQNYCCMLCGRHEDEIRPTLRKPKKGRPPDPLIVEHCHETGAVGGLVCTKCNNGLSAFNDDPDMLRKAIAYLKLRQRKAPPTLPID